MGVVGRRAAPGSVVGNLIENNILACGHRSPPRAQAGPRNEKGAVAGAFHGSTERVDDQAASALMADDRRDFVRETRFLCTIFLSAMRSITACDSCIVLAAAALSPVAMALLDLLYRGAQFRLEARVTLARCFRLPGALLCLRRIGHGECFLDCLDVRVQPERALLGKIPSKPGIIACFRCLDKALAAGPETRRAAPFPPPSPLALRFVNLLRALSTVSGMTLLSRITGLARESLKAAVFGAGVQMDAFEAAFRLPNILRRMFAEGAFSQAFVPILAEYHRQRGADATRDLVGRVGTLLAVVLLGVTVAGRARGAVARLPAGQRLRAHAGQGGTDGGDDPHRVSVHPVRVAGVAGGRRAQRVPAVSRSPRSRRCCSTCRSSAPRSSCRATSIRRSWRWPGACSSAASRSSLLQIAPLARIGMLPRPRFDWRDEGVRRVLARWGPAMIGVSAAQISALHQHAAGGVAGRRPHLVDHLRGPPDGVSQRAAGRGARHGAAAVAREASQRREPRGVLVAARLGLAARVPAGAAGGRSRCGCSRCRSSRRSTSTASSPSTTSGRRARRCSATASGLLGLILVKILAPGLLCAAEDEDAGEDRVLHRARHADAGGDADVAAGARRADAGDEPRRCVNAALLFWFLRRSRRLRRRSRAGSCSCAGWWWRWACWRPRCSGWPVPRSSGSRPASGRRSAAWPASSRRVRPCTSARCTCWAFASPTSTGGSDQGSDPWCLEPPPAGQTLGSLEVPPLRV